MIQGRIVLVLFVFSGCFQPSSECHATTCVAAGADCGAISNGCGKMIDCGACDAPQTCGGSGTANVCGCDPEADTQLCTALGVGCGPAMATDRCGTVRAIASCGVCSLPLTCGGAGTSRQCGCAPETDLSFCAREGRSCGRATAADNCGNSRSVASCGTCAATQACDTAGACVCALTLCAGACVDVSTDQNHCGACGIVCGAGEHCSNGACCQGALTSCSAAAACVDLASDAHHCGDCARDCLDGPCVAGRCQPVVLASAQDSPVGITVDSRFVYWTNASPSAGQVMRALLDGGEQTELAPQAMPLGIAVRADTLYWMTTSYTWQAVCLDLLDGGVPIVLSDSQPLYATGHLALNSTSLMWTAGNGSGPGVVYALPLDGGTRVKITDGAAPIFLAIDDTQAFWTEEYTGNLMRTPLDGGPSTSLYAGQYYEGLIVDDSDLYWTENHVPGFALKKMSKAGGPVVSLFEDPMWRGGRILAGITTDSHFIYWVIGGYANGRVMKLAKTGGTPITLVDNLYDPTQLVVDADHVYWTTWQPLISPGLGGSVMKLAK